MSVEGDSGDAPSPPPSPYPPAAPFKPSVVVVVGILTTVFSITFLLLLYAKHCKRATNAYGGSPGPPPSAARKNSGVSRAVVESLPVFRFGSLRGPKDGLECAVCLSRFEPSEVLRLLPKCKHAFHVECVDTWLDAHSTCPLCRYRVDPEDILLVQELSNPLSDNQPLPPPGDAPAEDANIRTQRVSGRHSSAGERGSNNSNKLLQIILQSSSRRSLDSRTKPANTLITKITSSSSSTTPPDSRQIPISFGRIDKSRKDGLLLASVDDQETFQKRFEHRITISNNDGECHPQRWSDLQPSDSIYLRSEMIINESRRRYSSARGSPNQVREPAEEAENRSRDEDGGKIVNNPRSASDIIAGNRRRNACHTTLQMRSRQMSSVLSRWLTLASSHGQRHPVDHHSLPL